MFEKENQNWEPFRDLTELMENTDKKQVPDGFTAQIMTRLAKEKDVVPRFSFTDLFSTTLNFRFRYSVTKTECSFYFLLTGFFYFILGLILMIGLPLPAVMQTNQWLSFQPVLGLLLAFELAVIGIILYQKGHSAIFFARMGTLLYTALVILNCWIGTFYVQFPVALLFMAIFSLTGLGIAFLLALAIDQYHPETIASEVNG